MVNIPFNQEHIDYVLELLNNERYTGNANAQLAESLIARIVASESTANSEAASEDAYWSAREAELLDECIEADVLARTLEY